MPTSTLYKIERKIKNPVVQKEEADLRDEIEKVVLEFSGYGYRRVTQYLQQKGFKINHKRVLRIMKQSDLLCSLERAFK